MRPATDALRQALFSSLAARVSGARFLDLFAGSGAYGLEALSRGAAGGLWVEKNKAALACLERNLAAVLKSISTARATPGHHADLGENIPDDQTSRNALSPISIDSKEAQRLSARQRRFGKTDGSSILNADVNSPRWEPAAAALRPDLVFIDPPYEVIQAIAAPLFARLHALLAAPAASPGQSDPLVVMELPGGLELKLDGWHCAKRLGGKGPRQPSLALYTRL
ncbi:hypothetical protein AXK11_00960 [Cephaloticoccus primus]|uniref:Methyltransferase n=1 Tax=Cephaloticoccus primus TaxID=1548207 RepID=A0A139SUB6_9BACT|nr:hypothetical protein AXK11_00960 [Cephaloticoccus primus]